MNMNNYEGYKVTKLPSTARFQRKSLWGVKSRVSGKNRKGQVAAPVGRMNSNQLMEGGVMRAR